MAIGWWLETGIYSKMADDVGRNQNWTKEWTRPTTNPRGALELSHILPPLIIFGVAITCSIIVFWLELGSKSCKMGIESHTQMYPISKD